MKIIQKGLKTGYTILKVRENHYYVCRLLNDYDNEEDAENDMFALLMDEKSEKQLLKEFTKKGF